MREYKMFTRITIFFIAVVWAMPMTAGATLTARSNHDHISIDSFYHGSEVSVRGICDPDTELVVTIESEEGHIALKKKDRVGGVLWMNVGDESFEHVPNLYFVQSTANIDDILDPAEQEKYLIGYRALEKHADIEPAAGEKEKAEIFEEFVKLKEASKLYLTATGGFDIENKDGARSYYMKFDWPYQARPGDYKVTVYAVKDKKVVETADAAVKVEQVGVVKTLSGMAKNNSGLYGVLSVIVALAAGFGVGIVFKGGGAH